jgi:hypothetical protein
MRMNQLYAEADVKRKNTIVTMALRFFMILGIVLGFLMLMYGGIFSIIGIVLIIVIVFMFPKLNVEYEYVFVDGQLDFDRITAKSKRKTMLRIDFEQVDIMAPINSHSLDEYKNIQCEQKDYSSREKSDSVYAIISSHGGKKLKILFEPNERMIGMIKQKSPRKVVTF